MQHKVSGSIKNDREDGQKRQTERGKKRKQGREKETEVAQHVQND